MNNIEQIRYEAQNLESQADIKDAIYQAGQLEKIARDQDVCEMKQAVVKTIVRGGISVVVAATTGISI